MADTTIEVTREDRQRIEHYRRKGEYVKDAISRMLDEHDVPAYDDLPAHIKED